MVNKHPEIGSDHLDYRDNYKAMTAFCGLVEAALVQPAARCITRCTMQKPASARKASRDNHRHVTAARPVPFLRALRGLNPTEEAP